MTFRREHIVAGIGAVAGFLAWSMVAPEQARAWWGCMQGENVFSSGAGNYGCDDCPDSEEDGYDCGGVTCASSDPVEACGCHTGSSCSNWR